MSEQNPQRVPNPASSACIPPPSDYTPKVRQPRTARHNDRAGRRNFGHGNRPVTFHKDGSRKQYACNSKDDQISTNQPKDRFYRNEDDDYFALVEDEESVNEISANNDSRDSGGNDGRNQNEPDDEEEEDPLDAYMKSLEGGGNDKSCRKSSSDSVVCKEDISAKLNDPDQTETAEKKAIRLDIDGTDDIEESYYKYVEQTSKTSIKRGPGSDNVQSNLDDLEERQNLVEYDKDGNVLSVKRTKREIEPLPPIDHSKIDYKDFQKVFYQEHEEISKLNQEQSVELRAKLEIKVSGESPPKPVCSFAHFKFDEQLMKVIRRSDYTQPTPIQAQAIPAALLGRNIIGIAMTGSGKTAAYLWPMIVHIMGQPDLKRGDGPMSLVLVPTRELALQVYGQAKKFSNSYKIAVVCAYGGGSKYEQSRDLEMGAEIVVGTPGRIIDLIKMGATNLRRVTYLVLDEADRFFEMGFEAQVRSICDQIRPDRQTLLFSATFKHKIEQLARTVTEKPIKIIQKELGEANEDVNQHVIVFESANISKKWDWFISKLVEFTSTGSVLVFVTRIINAEELHKNVEESGKEVLLLHGDMEQSERNRVITAFKRKEKDIMIATDVAARGLDISHIRTVINYDVARDIDTHIHRIGRTGRAGLKGDAYTLITDKDKEFAGHLVKNLESSNQVVDKDLMKLAMQSHNFRKGRRASSVGGPHHNTQHKGHSSNQRQYHDHQKSHNRDYRGNSSHKSYSHRYQGDEDRHSSPNDRHRRDRDSNAKGSRSITSQLYHGGYEKSTSSHRDHHGKSSR